jgi:hypothetical protein
LGKSRRAAELHPVGAAHPFEEKGVSAMEQSQNRLGYLGFLGILGFLGYLAALLNNPGLCWLHLFHLFFLFFAFFALPSRRTPSLHSLQLGQASPGLQQSSDSVVRITEPADISIPIYLNQQVVFDSIAIIEDGFSRLSTIKTSTAESETDKSGLGASIGASNVFALLGVSLSSERGKETGSQEQTEKMQERVHTPTSLFAKLRLSLKGRNLLRYIETQEDLEQLNSGEFVEFKALLKRNPLVETIESFKQLMEMAIAFDAMQGQRGSKGKRAQDPNAIIMRQMDSMLDALTQSNSIELIGELLDVPGVKSVLTARLDFFSQDDASEIIDGEFRILGKVTRVVAPDSGESINLLRKTAFGRFDHRLFDRLADAFVGSEEIGIRFPELITEVEGPAFQIVPVAIFT